MPIAIHFYFPRRQRQMRMLKLSNFSRTTALIEHLSNLSFFTIESRFLDSISNDEIYIRFRFDED